MILYIMLVALGFLIAMLLALLLAPAFWRRAERLTARRLEQSMPMSIAEAEAERDQIRASYAIIIRRLEAALSQEKMRSARQLVKISRLQMEIADLNDRTRQLRGQLDAEHNAASVLRRTIATRVPELNRAAHDAKQLVHVRDSEINTIVNRLRHREEALAIAQRTTEMQQAEIARLRHAMEMSGAQNASRFKLRPTEWTIHDYRAEYDRLNVELSKLRERLAVAYDREANQVKELRTELQQLADHVVAAASALPDEGEARRAIAHHAAADQPRQLASPTEQMDAPMRSIDAIIGDSVGGARASGLSDGSVPTRRSARSGGALARAADAPKRLALGAVQKVAGLAGATGKAMRVVSGSARNEEPAPMPGEVSAARLLGGAAVSDTHTDGSRVSGVGPAITKSADARPGSLSADAAAPKSPPETEAKERPDAPDDATPGPVDAATASVPEASAARASQPQTTGHTPPPEPDKARDQTDGDGSLYDSYRSAKPASAKPASDKPASDEPGSGKRTDAGATAAPAPSEAEAAAHTEEPAPAEQTSKASHTPTGSEDRAPEPGPTDANATGGETPGSLLDRLKHVPESETR